MNILKFFDIHKKMLKESQTVYDRDNMSEGGNETIDTIIQLGILSRDAKTTLYAATSLAHITEILDCDKHVANKYAIGFMMDML